MKILIVFFSLFTLVSQAQAEEGLFLNCVIKNSQDRKVQNTTITIDYPPQTAVAYVGLFGGDVASGVKGLKLERQTESGPWSAVFSSVLDGGQTVLRIYQVTEDSDRNLAEAATYAFTAVRQTLGQLVEPAGTSAPLAPAGPSRDEYSGVCMAQGQ